jgi:5'-deoxynucleotidase YfbR-like HD superfamily hydrolase
MNINITEVLFGPLRRMHHVNRYSSIPMIKPKHVAGHSWDVAMISYMIALDLDTQGVTIAMPQLLRRCIMHDVSEALSGDIIRSYKYSSQALRTEMVTADRTNVRMLAARLGNEGIGARIFRDWHDAKDGLLEGRIVALADMLAVYAECVEEAHMGNMMVMGVMEDLYKETLRSWHDVEFIGQYVTAVFPNKQWDDPLTAYNSVTRV